MKAVTKLRARSSHCDSHNFFKRCDTKYPVSMQKNSISKTVTKCRQNAHCERKRYLPVRWAPRGCSVSGIRLDYPKDPGLLLPVSCSASKIRCLVVGVQFLCFPPRAATFLHIHLKVNKKGLFYQQQFKRKPTSCCTNV